MDSSPRGHLGNPDSTMPDERSQPQKDKTICLLLYAEFKIAKLTEAESRMGVARNCGRKRNGEVMVKGNRISVMQDESILELYSPTYYLQVTVLYGILKIF